MPRTHHSMSYLHALQMVIRNICTLSAVELEDLIEDNTALVANDENGDYVVQREKG